MKRKDNFARRCLVLLIVAALLTACVWNAPRAFAATQESSRFNVELVIDGSNSLDWQHSPTDPDGYRFDALDLFMALLTERGNHVGAVIFHGSAEEFELNRKIEELDGRDAKLALSQLIRSAETKGGTNIGSALLQGVQKAADKHKENGLPSVVILFSDGRTDISDDKEREASLRDKENATALAQTEGIPVYTICLAATDAADPAELQEIATRTSGSFVKVQDAEDLTKGFETFYELIFGAAGKEIQKTIDANGEVEVEFEIPAYGAEEVNIILDTRGVEGKVITGPNGTVSDAQIAAQTMTGGYYEVIKLVEPDPGKYFVKLTGAAKQNVTVNVLFNINSDAQLTTADGRNDYSTGDTVTFQANLIQNGAPVADAAVTTDYTAKLIVKDLQSGSIVVEEAMTPNGNGTFTYDFKSTTDSSYTASAELVGADMSLSTNEWPLNFGNTAPVAEPDHEVVKKTLWFFFGKSHTLELKDYFEDAQDGDNLKYTIASCQLKDGSWTLDEQNAQLIVDPGASGSGIVEIQAADAQGAAAQLSVHYQIKDLRYIITGGTLLLIGGGIALAAAIVYASKQKKWSGKLSVKSFPAGAVRTYGDFRGKLTMKKLGMDVRGLNGYFRAKSGNGISFVSKKPVFTDSSKMARKEVGLATNSIRIYVDEARTTGIEVVAEGNKFAGRRFDVGIGGPKKSKAKKNTNSARNQNPFG